MGDFIIEKRFRHLGNPLNRLKPGGYSYICYPPKKTDLANAPRANASEIRADHRRSNIRQTREVHPRSGFRRLESRRISKVLCNHGLCKQSAGTSVLGPIEAEQTATQDLKAPRIICRTGSNLLRTAPNQPDDPAVSRKKIRTNRGPFEVRLTWIMRPEHRRSRRSEVTGDQRPAPSPIWPRLVF